LANLVAVAADAASATDSVSGGAAVLATVLESSLASDTALPRYLWELIDDYQSTNWQNVNNSQTSSWDVIVTQ
jgi:hypothetical protein